MTDIYLKFFTDIYLKLMTTFLSEGSPEFLLAGNPWECDCDLQWMKTVNRLSVKAAYARVLDIEAVTCGGAANLTAVTAPTAHRKLPI